MSSRILPLPAQYNKPHPPADAGLVGLEAEIRALPSDRLIDDATLMVETLPAMWDTVAPRLRYTLWTLRDRLVRP